MQKHPGSHKVSRPTQHPFSRILAEVSTLLYSVQRARIFAGEMGALRSAAPREKKFGDGQDWFEQGKTLTKTYRGLTELEDGVSDSG